MCLEFVHFRGCLCEDLEWQRAELLMCFWFLCPCLSVNTARSENKEHKKEVPDVINCLFRVQDEL